MTEQTNAVTASAIRVLKYHKLILNSLSFTVKSGTITGLIGPSGSGKSTLIRAIVGVQSLTSGTLTVLGEPAGSATLRPHIGYVTQSPSVYGDLSVEQNLHYFASVMNVSRSAVSEIIDTVRLREQRTQIVDTLSGGQRARVSLAVALLGEPQLLVLDEPTVGLDPILREELWSLFQRLADSGKTLIISSHVMDEAERCEQLLLLRDGKIIWNDTKTALTEKTRTSSVGEAFVAIVGEGK